MSAATRQAASDTQPLNPSALGSLSLPARRRCAPDDENEGGVNMHAVEPFLARARQPTPGPGSGASHDKQVLAGLLDATAAGDERAFAQLHRRTSARLRAAAWRVLRRHDLAEEAVQDAYMQIWAHAAKYRATVSAPMTWMTTIVRNRALDHLRQRQRESVWLADSDEEVDCESLASESPDPETLLTRASELRAAHQALAALGEMERRALELSLVDELSHVEVAAALGAPLGSVKSWIRRGLERVRGKEFPHGRPAQGGAGSSTLGAPIGRRVRPRAHPERRPRESRENQREGFRIERLDKMVIEPRGPGPLPVLRLAPAGDGHQQYLLAAAPGAHAPRSLAAVHPG
jgi:RNA polymerase sigma-70 factor (ECF subfamily)